MAIVTMILGESGTGKSTSLRNLNKENVLLIQVVKKPLPFKNDWKIATSENPGQIFQTDNAEKIIKCLNRSTKKIIIIDDFQYILANEFMRRVMDKETGNQAFQKYNEIAKNAWDILMTAVSLDDDKRIYILSHSNTDEHGMTKIKTIGKLLDDKIVLEGLVTIVLRSLKINDQYVFSTRNNGADTVKTPLEMFEEDHIKNDLNYVDQSICNYYSIGA